MRTLLKAMVGGCAVVALGAADAALVSVDMLAAGDGLLTRDTDTRLDWLDVTATLGLSVEDVRSGVGNSWYALGFTHATLQQTATLFLHSANGVTLNTTSWGDPNTLGANYEGASNLIGLMGETLLDVNYPGGVGFVATDDGRPGYYYLPYFQVEAATSRGQLTTEATAVAPGDTGYYWRGHYLVRVAPVPEPASLTLVGAALAGLAALTLIRKAA